MFVFNLTTNFVRFVHSRNLYEATYLLLYIRAYDIPFQQDIEIAALFVDDIATKKVAVTVEASDQ